MEQKGVVGASYCNPWIKPDIRPEELQDVLCYFTDGHVGISWCSFGTFMFEATYGPVLYWMPIPPLPKEDTL